MMGRPYNHKDNAESSDTKSFLRYGEKNHPAHQSVIAKAGMMGGRQRTC
jgi:hypothetical protein